MACACEMGAGMWWGMAIPTLVFAALVIGGVLIVRALWDRVGSGDVDKSRALSLLEERYARGEIDRPSSRRGGSIL
ncbi:MAG: SHOCT domain-containing protein [Actinomycetota bacterium]|nr:SHOCT domain-containing protein [Actinomycetota bacterium]